MRRIACLSLGLALAATLGAAPPDGPISGAESYNTVGEAAVQHNGRVKPLDTYARLQVKQVYTRENIKLLDAEGKVRETWEPLPALLDWRARPEFWDGQEIFAFEYLPLKQKLLSIPAHEALASLAKSGTLAADDLQRVEAAAKDPNVSSADLKAAAKLKGTSPELAATLNTLAHKIGPDQKWLSSDDLETGRIEIDGREVAFIDWIEGLLARPKPRSDFEEQPSYTPIETKALDAARRLALYRSIRDGNALGDLNFDVHVIPRPHTAAYLAFTTKSMTAYRQALQKQSPQAMGRMNPLDSGLSPLQLDAINEYATYANDIRSRDRHDPGENAEFDAAYTDWLREKSSWVALRILMNSDAAELASAGFDEAKIAAFRKSHDDLIAAEKAHPGRLPEAPAAAFSRAARDLGESVSVSYLLAADTGGETWNDLESDRLDEFKATRDPIVSTSAAPSADQEAALLASARDLLPAIVRRPGFLGGIKTFFATVFRPSAAMVPYPSEAAVSRELTFNRFAPFYKAQAAYGLGLVFLLVSLGFSAPAGTKAGLGERSLYGLGMLGLVSGIALEVIGFYYRIRISGWAPVTNMYETVIWVALVTSVLGLVLELIHRKTYAATAASGVALLATVLAANVSLLDPDIKNLQPVLRSNYWLTIHVLTIVSSYAAFALAMGLGLLAIGYYLSATYKKDVPYSRLALPFLPGLPMLVVGLGGLLYRGAHAAPNSPTTGADYGLGTLAMAGMFFSVMGLFAMIGEGAARASSKIQALSLGLLVLGVAGLAGSRSVVTPEWWPATVSLAVAPALMAGLGLMVVILSRMGAMARSVMVTSEAESGSSYDRELVGSRAEADRAFAATASGAPVATLARKPTVAEIRARQEANPVQLDPRREAMQTTANRIKPLSGFVYRAMQVGVLLVAAGTILGGVWADVSWGRFWGWDAKEVWALITLLVYLVPLHGRFAGWVNTFGLVAASVVCFASVMMAWYGVNFVLSTGLHTYGFAEGGGQGIVLSACTAVLAVVIATAYRRRLASTA